MPNANEIRECGKYLGHNLGEHWWLYAGSAWVLWSEGDEIVWEGAASEADEMRELLAA